MMKVLHGSDLAEVVSSSNAPVLLACDFDGTLAPIVSHPSLAHLPASTASLLRDLVATERVVLAIVSGRSLPDLRERVHVPAILAGNHGLEISGGGIEYVHQEARARAHLIEEAQGLVEPCLQRYESSWVENKGLTATVHFRQVPAAQRYKLMWDVRCAMRPFGLNLGMRAGKCSLELHPRVGWDKGHALAHIRQALGLKDSRCVVFGDDATDEAMFRAVPDEMTVRVGPAARTNATYFLPSPAAVSMVLEHSLEVLTANSSPLARAAG